MLVKLELKNKEIYYNNSMKDNQTIAQFLKVKAFPFIVNDDKGNIIYYEDSDGYWTKYEYDDQSNPIYFEDTNGYWTKLEYDKKGNEVYYEDSKGIIIDKRPKPMIELTLADIAKLKGVDVGQIRIKE
jgi:YD repeat-containing protein